MRAQTFVLALLAGTRDFRAERRARCERHDRRRRCRTPRRAASSGLRILKIKGPIYMGDVITTGIKGQVADHLRRRDQVRRRGQFQGHHRRLRVRRQQDGAGGQHQRGQGRLPLHHRQEPEGQLLDPHADHDDRRARHGVRSGGQGRHRGIDDGRPRGRDRYLRHPASDAWRRSPAAWSVGTRDGIRIGSRRARPEAAAECLLPVGQVAGRPRPRLSWCRCRPRCRPDEPDPERRHHRSGDRRRRRRTTSAAAMPVAPDGRTASQIPEGAGKPASGAWRGSWLRSSARALRQRRATGRRRMLSTIGDRDQAIVGARRRTAGVVGDEPAFAAAVTSWVALSQSCGSGAATAPFQSPSLAGEPGPGDAPAVECGDLAGGLRDRR